MVDDEDQFKNECDFEFTDSSNGTKYSYSWDLRSINVAEELPYENFPMCQ